MKLSYFVVYVKIFLFSYDYFIVLLFVVIMLKILISVK